MFGIKKKLSALVPTESARNALQNVLTVEWEGQGKTVLVEVPAASPTRTNEVEMSGFGASGRLSGDDRRLGGYGRLEDDEDQQYLSSAYASPPPLPPKPGFNSSRFEEYSGSSDGHSVTSRDGRYHPSSSSSSQHRGRTSLAPPRLPTRPSFNRQEIANPFEEADLSSDTDRPAPRTHHLRPALPSRGNSATSDYGSYSGYSSGTDPLSDDGYMARGHAHGASALPPDGSGTIVAKKPWATFDEHPSRQMYPVEQISQPGKRTDPWSASGWSATTSPTSSRGTHTNAIEPEDPFAE